MEINYRNIRNATSHLWFERALSEHLCMLISPLFSIYFIKRNIKPNTITLFMVISGIIAPIMFMFNSIHVKCIASVLFLLWFIFDCSDGEVARFTQTFSKHGRDLDYLSHVSCHSLFIMSMWKLYALHSEYLLPLSIFFFSLLAAELFNRICVLYTVYVFKPDVNLERPNRLLLNFRINVGYFPNFVVFFPCIYCISTILGFDVFILFMALFSFYIILMLKDYFSMLVKFYKS